MGEWSCNGKCPLLESLMADGSVGLLLFTGDPPAPRTVNWFLGQMLWCLSVKTQLFSSSISQSCFILGLIGLGAGRGCMIAHGTGVEIALTLHLLPQTSTYSLPQRSTLRAIQSTFMPGFLTSLLLLSISFLFSLGAFTWAFRNKAWIILPAFSASRIKL